MITSRTGLSTARTAGSAGSTGLQVINIQDWRREGRKQLPIKVKFSAHTPIIHASASQLYTVKVRCEQGAPVEVSTLRRAVKQVRQMNKEVEYAKQAFRKGSAHAITRFYALRDTIKVSKARVMDVFQARAAEYLLQSEEDAEERRKLDEAAQQKWAEFYGRRLASQGQGWGLLDRRQVRTYAEVDESADSASCAQAEAASVGAGEGAGGDPAAALRLPTLSSP
jgi:uncharacterized membrane protein